MPEPIILCGGELAFNIDLLDIKLLGKAASQDFDAKTLTCRGFCLKSKFSSKVITAEVK